MTTVTAMDIAFPEKLVPFVDSNRRFNVAYGGRGGAKSWAFSKIVILKAYQKKKLVLCTREVQNTIRDSVYKLLCDMIERLGLSSFFDISRDTIIGKNGSKFIFRGLKHNISEIKSMEGVDICWIEEGQNISRESLDVLVPTLRKEGSQFYICFNPDNENDPIYQDFVAEGMHNSLVVKINYNDNPFFPDVLLEQMEWEKKHNYDKFQHIWEGNVRSISDACIFKGKFTVESFEIPKDEKGNPIEVDFYYGADWGFSVDPAVLVRSFIYDDNLYVDYEAYGVGVDFDELPQLFDTIPESRNNKIVADNSRPDTISYVNKKGFVVRGSRKGKNSIKDGIEFIRKFKKVIIHPRCKNTKYEFESYSYKRDKITNEILPIIVDKDNHIIDALRYSLEDIRRGSSTMKVSEYSKTELLGW